MTPPVASFRDPAGSCCTLHQRVLRWLGVEGAAELEAFLLTPSARGFIDHGQLVSTQRLDESGVVLAVIHHLLAAERIPLEEILRLAAELSSSCVIVEFIGLEDATFRHLVRGRAHLHSSLTEGVFEAACAPQFEIMNSVPLPGTHRRLYALKRKGAVQ